MAQMLNGLKLLFKGKNALERQISLFSICGIAGILNGYLALGMQDMAEVNLTQKIISTIFLIIFAMFFIGYETLFMHKREIPDIDMQSFKLALKKIPFIIFIIGIPFLLISLFTKYQYIAFCIETLIAIPLTMLQAGFSYNFNNEEAGLMFKKFGVYEYFMLLVKRLWVVILSHIVTFTLIFLIFFIIGVAIAFSYKGDPNAIALTISAQQTTILKLSNFLASILLVYTMSISILVWDYELLKTYENENSKLNL